MRIVGGLRTLQLIAGCGLYGCGLNPGGPDADLDTLGAALGLSRSAVNHRLRRLVELASTEEH